MDVLLFMVLCSVESFVEGDISDCTVYYAGSYRTEEDCNEAAIAAFSIDLDYLETETTIPRAVCIKEVNIK